MEALVAWPGSGGAEGERWPGGSRRRSRGDEGPGGGAKRSAGLEEPDGGARRSTASWMEEEDGLFSN